MKNIVYKEYRQNAALICGITFLILGCITLWGIISIKLSLAEFPQFLFFPILFFIMGFFDIFVSYKYLKTGIKEIIDCDSNILITAFGEETKKEYTLNLPKSEILSCNVDISHTEDCKKFLIDFDIKRKDGINHRIMFHTKNYNKVKEILGLGEYIPNFSWRKREK